MLSTEFVSSFILNAKRGNRNFYLILLPKNFSIFILRCNCINP
jgi:hypothetical protein